MARNFKTSQETINERTIAYRQKMLDFFKREGGATFIDMHAHIEPDADEQKLYYHFGALKKNGYLKKVGMAKRQGAVRNCKIWKAIIDTYTYTAPISTRPIKERDHEDGKLPPSTNGQYVNGVLVVRMRHAHRSEYRTRKVYIGSTMGML